MPYLRSTLLMLSCLTTISTAAHAAPEDVGAEEGPAVHSHAIGTSTVGVTAEFGAAFDTAGADKKQPFALGVHLDLYGGDYLNGLITYRHIFSDYAKDLIMAGPYLGLNMQVFRLGLVASPGLIFLGTPTGTDTRFVLAPGLLSELGLPLNMTVGALGQYHAVVDGYDFFSLGARIGYIF